MTSSTPQAQPSVLGICGLTVATDDVDATREAWCRLSGAQNTPALVVGGVALGVAPAAGGPTGLTSACLAVSDLSVMVEVLGRRGLRVSSSNTLDLAGATWRLAGGTGVVVPGAPGDLDGIDHLVIDSDDVDRAAGLYGARLGLDLRLDRTFPRFGMRALFLTCGDTIVEVVTPAPAREGGAGPDRFSGVAWKTDHLEATRERLLEDEVDVSEIREGRKPGTWVCTVRDPDLVVPTLLVASGDDQDQAPAGGE